MVYLVFKENYLSDFYIKNCNDTYIFIKRVIFLDNMYLFADERR